ncbi:MAG: DUF2284 domain-containing protein, partial [archaeon]|nr:DUF2284 domain-containing protein [archaeon]
RVYLMKKACEGVLNSNLFIDSGKPSITLNSVRKNREVCRTNRCGNYGRNLACPPFLGNYDVCVSSIDYYDIADLFTQTFEGTGSDKVRVREIVGEFQDTCRNIMVTMRRNGFDVMTLTVGGCNYCKRCAALDGQKCRYPEMVTLPISGYGIDISEYVHSIGGNFTFGDKEITLYCVFLTKLKEDVALGIDK